MPQPTLGTILIYIVVIVIVFIIAFFLGITYRKKFRSEKYPALKKKRNGIINDSIKAAESKKREALLEAKEEIHKNRVEYEREVKERRTDLQKQERRLQQKEEGS